MNLIFDIGNVLVNYKPVTFLEGLFSDRYLVVKMYNTIFKSPEWLYMDQGNMTRDEAIDVFCAREPEFALAIRITIQSVNEIFTPKQETIELLPKLLESGHSLYFLSNMQSEIRDFLLDKYEFFNLFHGGIFSCDVHAIKPSPEIYLYLLEKYRLIPEDCIFFDDVEENVTAAEKEGMKGVLFTTAECVLPYLV